MQRFLHRAFEGCQAEVLDENDMAGQDFGGEEVPGLDQFRFVQELVRLDDLAGDGGDGDDTVGGEVQLA